MTDEDECTWIALEAATRNVVALLCIRNKRGEQLSPPVCRGPEGETAGLERVPAALTRDWGADGAAAGLDPQGEHADGDKLRKIG